MRVESYSTLTEAANSFGDKDRFIGGGTLVMREVNYSGFNIDRVLYATDSSLREIRSESGRIRIGSGVTMTDVINSHELAMLAPVARSIGGPAIRNMATVGGNLFAPHPYGDFAAALLALDAEVVWADGRSTSIEEFLNQRNSSRGLVAAVSVPRVNTNEFRYLKVSRTKPKGISVMSIAAKLIGAPGRISEARVAFGAMGPTPLRAKSTEAALQGVSLDAASIQRALDVCTAELSPPDDPLSSAWYRQEVAPVHLKRLLLGEGVAS